MNKSFLFNKILVFGDSISYGKWDSEGGWVNRLRKYFDSEYNLEKNGNYQVYSLGIPGEVAVRMVNRFETELSHRMLKAEKILVLLAIGINDSCKSNWIMGKQTPEAEFKESVINMIDIAKKFDCTVAIIGLTPVNQEKSNLQRFFNDDVKQYDKYLTEISVEKMVPKLELFDCLTSNNFEQTIVDDAHPNNMGHEMIFSKVRDFINKLN